MKQSRTLVVLTVLIAVLALVAAATSVFYRGTGAPYEFTTLRGETVMISGHGIYAHDPVDMAAQGIAQDVVTLVVGLPLLLVALWQYRRGKLRGHLLLAGTLAYFLYTYTSLAFGASFNALFLVYVALFSMSLFAFIIAMLSVDTAALPAHFTEKLPRRAVAGFMCFGAAFLLLAWSGRIMPALLSGGAPVGLSSNTTLFIQVMDLGLIVPLMIVSAVTLLQRKPLGYLLSSVALIKFVTMGLALVAMIIGQALAGVQMAPAEVVIFPVLALAGLIMAVLMLRDLHENVPAVPAALKPTAVRSAMGKRTTRRASPARGR
jgi:hypothetical protein